MAVQFSCFVSSCLNVSSNVLAHGVAQLSHACNLFIAAPDFRLQELSSVRGLLQKQQKAQSRQRLEVQRWGLTARMVRVAVAVYCCSQYSKDCAGEYAVHARKRRRSQVLDLKDVECPIQQWFLEADVDDVVGFLVPETQEQQSIRKEAIHFLAEKRTADWVAAQNFNAGTAPTGSSLVDHYAAELRRFRLEARVKFDPPRLGRGPRLGRMARKWCQRMRVKWGLRRGKLREREPLAEEEVAQKAGRGVKFGSRFWLQVLEGRPIKP